MPYYEENIKKDLLNGENVLVVAHGNTLRALIKHLENLDEVKISEVEFETGQVHIYELDHEGKILSKDVKSKN